MNSNESPFKVWESVALVLGVLGFGLLIGWILQTSIKSVDSGDPFDKFPIIGLIGTYIVLYLFDSFFMGTILWVRNFRLMVPTPKEDENEKKSQNSLQHGKPFFLLSERLLTRYTVVMTMLCFILPLWWETELSGFHLTVLILSTALAASFIMRYYRNTSESSLYNRSANPIFGF